MSGVTRLLDGPAVGAALMLRRAPIYLRVVVDAAAAKTDALDQLDDEPEPHETVHVYRQVEGTRAIVCIRPGGCYHGADYVHVPDVDGESVRDTAAWREWAEAQR